MVRVYFVCVCVGDDDLKCAWVSNNQPIEREREKEKEREREREWLVVYHC